MTSSSCHVALTVAVFLACTACTQPAPDVLTTEGYKASRFGMTVAEAQQALGAELSALGPPEADPNACHIVRRVDGQDPLVTYMVEGGKIVRVDIAGRDPPPPRLMEPTINGVGIGSGEDDVLRAYGKAVVVQPHKYVDAGHYLIVDSPAKDRSLIFETEAGKVTRFRAGLYPAVGYVEGCS